MVVSWNSAEYVVECIKSLVSSCSPADALLVDNCSDDRTVALVEEEFPSVRVVQTGSNLGYAGANNLGLRFAQDHAYDLV